MRKNEVIQKWTLIVMLLAGCRSTQRVNSTIATTNLKDTACYCQTHSPWISNCFCFYRENASTVKGIFEKKMESDDGQNWYGRGTFVEKPGKITLSSFNLIHSINGKITDSTIVGSLTLVKKSDRLVQDDKQDGKVSYKLMH